MAVIRPFYMADVLVGPAAGCFWHALRQRQEIHAVGPDAGIVGGGFGACCCWWRDQVQTSLPIWQIHGPIVQTPCATGNRLVLVAPTGSGKTTQVPQMLLDSGLAPGRIVVLQPRRVAARTVAARVAWERHVKLGGEVGYQIRFEDRTSLGTRICFVTEGILLRWLQDDPQLHGISAILFDEFHERNLLSDVALALAKRLQETRRPDLRIVVMSATLEAEPVAKYLGDCPVLVSEGKAFPGRNPPHRRCTTNAPFPNRPPISSRKSSAPAIRATFLIFMPGMGEINATIAACRAAGGAERLALIPLHGELPPEEQDLAFAPNRLRKVVVATNVAETSVTIDGIVHVIDSGLARVARYDAERGIGTLVHRTDQPRLRRAARRPGGADGARRLPPPLDRKRPPQPARTQHAGNSAQRSGGSRPAAAFPGHHATPRISIGWTDPIRRPSSGRNNCCASWARLRPAARAARDRT